MPALIKMQYKDDSNNRTRSCSFRNAQHDPGQQETVSPYVQDLPRARPASTTSQIPSSIGIQCMCFKPFDKTVPASVRSSPVHREYEHEQQSQRRFSQMSKMLRQECFQNDSSSQCRYARGELQILRPSASTSRGRLRRTGWCRWWGVVLLLLIVRIVWSDRLVIVLAIFLVIVILFVLGR